MRSRFFVDAIVCLGMGMLTACGQQQEQVGAEPEPVPAVVYDRTLVSNAQFLADNAQKAGVIVTPTGLQYRVIMAGTGERQSSEEDMATVSYSGSLIDGTPPFDFTDPGETITFPSNGLIAGWVEALKLMKGGDKWELVIPAELGYGSFGAGGVIPPNQVLVFEMELIKFGPPEVRP